MKVRLIPEKCIACGLCQTYSDHFDYYDNGIVKFADSEELVKELPDSDELKTAIKSCPTKALVM